LVHQRAMNEDAANPGGSLTCPLCHQRELHLARHVTLRHDREMPRERCVECQGVGVVYEDPEGIPLPQGERACTSCRATGRATPAGCVACDSVRASWRLSSGVRTRSDDGAASPTPFVEAVFTCERCRLDPIRMLGR
jgi:hypothetical protein